MFLAETVEEDSIVVISVTEEERVSWLSVLEGSQGERAVTYRPNASWLRLYKVSIAGGTDLVVTGEGLTNPWSRPRFSVGWLQDCEVDMVHSRMFALEEERNRNADYFYRTIVDLEELIVRDLEYAIEEAIEDVDRAYGDVLESHWEYMVASGVTDEDPRDTEWMLLRKTSLIDALEKYRDWKD